MTTCVTVTTINTTDMNDIIDRLNAEVVNGNLTISQGRKADTYISKSGYQMVCVKKTMRGTTTIQKYLGGNLTGAKIAYTAKK